MNIKADFNRFSELKAELELEREKVRKAREALKFYADKASWCEANPFFGLGVTIGQNDWELDFETGDHCAGVRAREALKELGEE